MWYDKLIHDTDALNKIYNRVKSFMSYSTLYAWWQYACTLFVLILALLIILGLATANSFSAKLSSIFVTDLAFTAGLVGIVQSILTTATLIGTVMGSIYSYCIYKARSQKTYYVDENAYHFVNRYSGRKVWWILYILSVVGFLTVGNLTSLIGDLYYRINYNTPAEDRYTNGNVLKFVRGDKDVTIYRFFNDDDQMLNCISI